MSFSLVWPAEVMLFLPTVAPSLSGSKVSSPGRCHNDDRLGLYVTTARGGNREMPPRRSGFPDRTTPGFAPAQAARGTNGRTSARCHIPAHRQQRRCRRRNTSRFARSGRQRCAGGTRKIGFLRDKGKAAGDFGADQIADQIGLMCRERLGGEGFVSRGSSYCQRRPVAR